MTSGLASSAGERVRVPVFGPVALAVLTLLAVSLMGIYTLQERRIDDQVADQVNEAKLFFHEWVEHDAQQLDGFAGLVARDRGLQQRWLARDRASLLKEAKPIFDDLRSAQGVTHLYFHNLDQVCFLRVHEPNRHGDLIERATLAGAVRTGRPSSGVELGPLATLTLRVVYPWRIDGQLAGYIELGEEVAHVIPVMRSILDTEFVVILDKSFLTKAGWEAGMKMLGRQMDWDLSDDFAVVDATSKSVTPELLALATSPLRYTGDRLFRLNVNGILYQGGVCPLRDAADRRVGAIIVLKDIDAVKAASFTLYGLLAGAGLAVAALLAVSFRWYVGRIERRLTTARDELKGEIRRRTSAEAELTRHRENLEILVSERTWQLQAANEALGREVTEHEKTQETLALLNRDLESAVHMLRMSNSDLQDLLQIAAHDLKAPVRSMGTLVDWIREDCSDGLTPTGWTHLDLLAQRARRLNRHLDRIVEYAAIGSSRQPMERIDLGMLLHEVIDGLAPPPHIQVLVDPGLPTFTANRTHMAQLFANILDNALRYMDKPRGLIQVSCCREGDAWRFSVHDNGPGIASQYHEKIFKMFQTLAPRDQIEATGIGLSMAKRIVDLYGGRIWLESVPGQGATFFFTLDAENPSLRPDSSASNGQSQS